MKVSQWFTSQASVRDRIIDSILNSMQYGEEYRYDLLWRQRRRDNSFGRRVDYEAAMEELLEENLIAWRRQLVQPALGDRIELTIKGERIKEAGGWLRVLRKKKRSTIRENVLKYGTFLFAATGVVVPVYYASQESPKQELGVQGQTVEPVDQDAVKDSTLKAQAGSQADSLHIDSLR